MAYIQGINAANPAPVVQFPQSVQAPMAPQTAVTEQKELPLMSPMLINSIMAQNKQIVTPKVKPIRTTPAAERVPGYYNNLKDMLTQNKANIFAVIMRTMNAQDKDGNELIQGDEIKGNFINDVERLDEIKDLGFNTLHILPIHPTSKSNAMGTAGSLYAPADFLTLDPELVDENPPEEVRARVAELYEQKTGKKLEKMDKNDPEVAFAQMKYFVDECHKRNIKVMLDLPSCGGLDFAKAHPEMMAVGADGKEKVPQGWQDIRMLRPFEDEKTRKLNDAVLDMHKKYIDMCVDLGVDGIRADVSRAKPPEFWGVSTKYSHTKDDQFGWLAETYTHEDASPQLNMPYDEPKDADSGGFHAKYGQWHILNEWTTADLIHKYVKECAQSENITGEPKSYIASIETHDDKSSMLYGGAPWVMFTTILQNMLPQVNGYMVDGTQTGDYYIYPYDHAYVRDTATDNHQCTVHTGRLDIFNNSRKPGGKFPEIAEVTKTAFSLKNNQYNEVNKNSNVKLQMDNAQDVITKGSYIILPTNNPEILAFARHKDGKTLLFIGNRNVNSAVGGKVTIPGLKKDQKFANLMPNYGEETKIQNNKDGSINVELGTARACVFEIDDKDIEKLSKSENIVQQKYLK